MRSSVLSLAALATALATSAACSKSDSANAADTAAAATATPNAAPSARLTAADLAGSWDAVTYEATGDSITGHWTIQMVDSTHYFTVAQTPSPPRPDTIHSTGRIEADSVVGTSEPFRARTGGPMIHLHSVSRLRDGKLVGTGWATLVDSDSVLSRWRHEGTRTR